MKVDHNIRSWNNTGDKHICLQNEAKKKWKREAAEISKM
jgi:hypothetical protein